VTYTDPDSGARVLSAGTLQFSWMLDSWRDGVSDYRDTETGQSDPRVQAFVRRALLDLAPPPVPPTASPPPAAPLPPSAPAVPIPAPSTGAPPRAGHGVVLEWGFGEGSGPLVRDARRPGASGVIHGARRVASGRFGRGILFSDRDDVLVSRSLARLAGASGMTLEAWIRPSRPGRGRVLRVTGGPRPLTLALTAGSRQARGSRAAPLVAVGRWTHVAITARGAAVRIYVNGALAARRTVGGAGPPGEVLKVGGGFVGRVDDVRVLAGTRSAAGLHADARENVRVRISTTATAGEGPPTFGGATA
jgi:hypothetical protein